MVEMEEQTEINSFDWKQED